MAEGDEHQVPAAQEGVGDDLLSPLEPPKPLGLESPPKGSEGAGRRACPTAVHPVSSVLVNPAGPWCCSVTSGVRRGTQGAAGCQPELRAGQAQGDRPEGCPMAGQPGVTHGMGKAGPA